MIKYTLGNNKKANVTTGMLHNRNWWKVQACRPKIQGHGHPSNLAKPPAIEGPNDGTLHVSVRF